MVKLPMGAGVSASLRQPASLRRSDVISATLIALAGVVHPVFADEAGSTETVALEPIKVQGNSTDGQKNKDANPNADAAAPYKVDRSGSAKRTEPLLDTPQSITVIPKETIKDSGATSVRDVMRLQPGVTLGTGEGGNAYGDRFIIRGFEARNDVFVDGLRDPGVVSREIFAVEQIEISKGPSSTFAGRGTTGGAVNNVSKLPGMDSFEKIEVGAGTDNYKRITLDANEQLSDSVAVRANLLFHDTDIAGRDHVDDQRKGAALALLYKATDDTAITVDYYHLETDSMPDWGHPYDVSRNRPADVDRDNFYGQVKRDYWETQSDIATVKVESNLSAQWRVSSQTRYGETSNAYIAGAPSRPDYDADSVNSSAKRRDQENEYIGHATNFITTLEQGDTLHTIVTGFELSRERISNLPPALTTVAGTDSISISNPDPYSWQGSISAGTSEAKAQIDTWALYVMDTVEINRWWEVFGGVRFDNYDIARKTIQDDYIVEGSEFDNKDTFVNWHLGVSYKPATNGTVYASIATSSNPVGEQVDASAADYGGIVASNYTLSPEQNTNYEIGTKWELFDRHALVNFALFQTVKDDARVNYRDSSNQSVSDKSGEVEVLGVELGIAGNISERWSMAGGMTYLNSEITESSQPQYIGLELANLAEKTFSLLNRYQLTDAFAVGMTASYRSEVNGGTWAATTTEIPDYWRFDLLAQYQFTQQLSARLNVLNATDEVYYDTLYRSSSPFVYVAPGRSAMVTIAYDF